MVTGRVKRLLAFLILAEGLLLLLPAALPAESRVTVDLDAAAAFSSGEEGIDSGWFGTGVARGAVTFDQTANPNVRSQLRLEAAMPSAAVAAEAAGLTGAEQDQFELPYDIAISRAYVKFRFPSLRATVGKAPVTWGEGRYFNAGNLPVALTASEANLVRQEFEDTALWQAGVYLPLGSFSFFETLWFPDETGLLLEDSSAGARLVLRPLGIKTEISWLFDGRDDGEGNYRWRHKAAAGFQGNLVVDWHLTAAASFPEGYGAAEALEETLRISAGLYTLLPAGYDGTLSLRLEALSAPFDGFDTELYPEVSWDFGNNLTVMLRSVVALADPSAIIIPGAAWNVFQGFSLYSFLSADTAGAGALALQAGCSVTY